MNQWIITCCLNELVSGFYGNTGMYNREQKFLPFDFAQGIPSTLFME